MSNLDELIQKGTSLGYDGETLRDFVKDQQDRLRDERAAERERIKHESEVMIEQTKMKLEQERSERELKLEQEKSEREKLKLEAEQDKLNREMKLKQMQYEHDLQMLEKKAALKINTADTSTVRPKAPKIPPFDESRDDIDSYLRRFERYAHSQNWDISTWATSLSALLKGHALDVYALLPSDKALDYNVLKDALLKRYDMTEDGYKRKFRSCRPEQGETFSQFTVRLSGYLLRWLEMSLTPNTFEGLFDLVMRDQLLHICNRDLTLFLKERTPKSVDNMAELADQFREARRVVASSLTNKYVAQKDTSVTPVSKASSSKTIGDVKPGERKGFIPKSERRCYKCQQLGHIASECSPQLRAFKGKVHAILDEDDNCIDADNSDQTSTCGAFIIPTESITVADASIDSSMVMTSSCQSMKNGLPVSAGFVEDKPVSVLRDSGCTGIVVRRSLVPDENMTGESHICKLADNSEISVPKAIVTIDTPYLSGKFTAWCMNSPVYDLILGNVDGVRLPGDPDPNWCHVHAVETRNQRKVRNSAPVSMKVPDIVKDDISPDDFRKAQDGDDTLTKIRALADSGKTFPSKNGYVKWCRRDSLVYREYTSSDNTVSSQLLVPQSLRTTVMRLAHESIMAGHMATKHTVSRVLSEFYWPGVQTDVKRFCQSCDICQRTVAKGKISKLPLQQMPLIDEPFHRVAVDLIGPLYPATDRGNRYVLTVVDYATRYPEAVALRNIDTECVAEALVDIFSRVGVPREMLSDNGSQFTSSVMKDVSRLISVRQLTTTPYHPMCNGLVERFNGTLKLMLKWMCAERPRDWDKYLNAVLFAYREVPQKALVSRHLSLSTVERFVDRCQY